MTKIEIVTDSDITPREVIIPTPWPTEPPPQDTPPIGLVELEAVTTNAQWFNGPSPPDKPGHTPGDMWLADDGSVWSWDGVTWTDTGINISSSDTAEEVLEKLKTVDGTGSGLDADLLDGHDSLYFATDADLDALGAATGSAITSLDTRLDEVEADNMAQDTAIGVNTSKNTEQDGRLNAVEAKNTAQDAAIAAINPFPEAPNDTNAYGRKAGAWTDVTEEAPNDGLGYMRKSGAWTPSTGGAYTDDNPPPGPLQDGQMWWKSDSGALYLWYEEPSGGSKQWVQVSASPLLIDQNYTRKTAETRNRLLNPAIQHSQEWGNNLVNNGDYPADGWFFGAVSSATVQAQRGTSGYIGIASTPLETAAAATEYIQLYQRMEGLALNDLELGTAASAQIVIAFDILARVAGVYSVAFRNLPSVTHSWLGSVTVTPAEVGNWVRKTVVIPYGAINAGTWPVNNTPAAMLSFVFHLGSSFFGVEGLQAGNVVGLPTQALGLSAAGAVQFRNVGLYKDPDRTGVAPPFEVPNWNDELQRCQRYLRYIDSIGFGWSGQAASGGGYVAFATYTNMRTTPVASGTNGVNAGFPATVGTLVPSVGGIYEQRLANASGVGVFRTGVKLDARP